MNSMMMSSPHGYYLITNPTSAKLPHVVCGNCGWYAGRQAIDVD